MYIYIYTVHVNHILTIQHLQFISTTPRARASPCACASAQPPPRPLEAASLPRKPVGSRGPPARVLEGYLGFRWETMDEIKENKRLRNRTCGFHVFLKGI